MSAISPICCVPAVFYSIFFYIQKSINDATEELPFFAKHRIYMYYRQNNEFHFLSLQYGTKVIMMIIKQH